MNSNRAQVQPRLIRNKDAPAYLGMDQNRFKAEVRPYLIEIPIGVQGIAFDRIDLDAWADQYKARCGRPAKKKMEVKPWQDDRCQGSRKGAKSGTSTSAPRMPQKGGFEKALELVNSMKPNGT